MFLVFLPSFLIESVEFLLVLEAVTRKMKANWVVSKCIEQILICGYRVSVIEFDLLRLDPILNLLKLFRVTDRWQHIIEVIG